MNIQDRIQEIHHKYGTTEKANYEIQLFIESLLNKQKEQSTSQSVLKRILNQKISAYDLICKWFAEEYSTDTDRDEVAEMEKQATELNAQIKVLRFMESTIKTD